MPKQIQNVVVFGDSLSDIGIKAKTALGKFARTIGQMTTNPSGRFSDCRNWTDFMYEEAAGKSLVSGDVGATKTASRVYQSLTAAGGVAVQNGRNFFYANYAEGGACGSKPAGLIDKGALGTFKDQVNRYRAEQQALNQTGPTLFLVWFGANDLYTAGCKPLDMADVAYKVAVQRRSEVEAIIGKPNANFIFMNLGRPECAVRYQELALERGTLKDDLWGLLGKDAQTTLYKLKQGADLYNSKLSQHVRPEDGLVDIASIITPSEITKILNGLDLLQGAEPEGPSYVKVRALKVKEKITGKQQKGLVGLQIESDVYNDQKMRTQLLGKRHIITADKVHPTDQVYKLMWKAIKSKILEKQYAFGNVG
jgi:phospholipase/lecithinase/hemolysin